MQLTLSWEGVTGVILLIGFLSGVNLAMIKIVVRDEFKDFRDSVVSKDKYEAEHMAIIDRLTKLEVATHE